MKCSRPSPLTREWWPHLLRVLLPRACAGCGAALGPDAALCASCRSSLRPRVESHSTLTRAVTPHLVTLGAYRGPLARSLRALKYGGSREVADVLGARLAQVVPSTWALTTVTAVPLHPRRERWRGYNHADLLARAVASALGLPHEALLLRSRVTRQQARLRGSAREANVRHAFRAARPVSGRVLLVDDVLTTGSTLRACADTLQAAGADEVYLLVAAR
jgi:ComF family protein